MNQPTRSTTTLTHSAAALGLAAIITLSILAGLDGVATHQYASASLAAAANTATQTAVVPQRAVRG